MVYGQCSRSESSRYELATSLTSSRPVRSGGYQGGDACPKADFRNSRPAAAACCGFSQRGRETDTRERARCADGKRGRREESESRAHGSGQWFPITSRTHACMSLNIGISRALTNKDEQ
eukprot:6342731-Pyramimonas_sp.AAC.2